MRNKDLKKLLRSKASGVEIKDFTNEILNNVNHTPAVIAKPKRRIRPFAYVTSGLAAVCACLIVALISIRTTVEDPKPNPDPLPGPITSLSKQEMVLTKEAVALGNVVETISSVSSIESSIAKLNAYSEEDNDEEEDEDSELDDEHEDNENEDEENEDNENDEEDNDQQIDPAIYRRIALEMNAFLYSADSFINSENLEASVSLNEDSSLPYSYKMEIIMLDHNFRKQYELYYNEDKQENVCKIEGIIVINEESHPIKGERKDKKDETNLILKLYLADNSYIAIENETEVNENEYEYSFYENGELVRSVSMEIETENGLKEASIEIEENGIKKEVELEYYDDRVEASYTSSDIELEMSIQIFDSYYLYYFEDADLKIELNK